MEVIIVDGKIQGLGLILKILHGLSTQRIPKFSWCKVLSVMPMQPHEPQHNASFHFMLPFLDHLIAIIGGYCPQTLHPSSLLSSPGSGVNIRM